jgi:hypothetical protein
MVLRKVSIVAMLRIRVENGVSNVKVTYMALK